MSFDVLGPVLAVLVIFAALIAVLRYLKAKDKSFTFRVFTALGMGIVLGAGIQLALGRGSDAATTALDWMSLVGTGYIDLLRMLVMPLVFVAIVGAFTRTKAVDNLGQIGGSVRRCSAGRPSPCRAWRVPTSRRAASMQPSLTPCKRVRTRSPIPPSRRPSCQ